MIRILLVPTLTELEWRIKPLLEEWADVASFDAPGVGTEPSVDKALPAAIVSRGIAEIEQQGWDACTVVGDEFGAPGAVNIAAERPQTVKALALGHACLSLSERGPRPSINGDVMGAMRKLSEVDYRTYARHMTQVTQGAYDEETAERYIERVPEEISRGFQAAVFVASAEMGSRIKALEVPLLLAKHEGCLAWTEEGWEDAVTAFPEATTMMTEEKPSCSRDFAEALRSFCEAS